MVAEHGDGVGGLGVEGGRGGVEAAEDELGVGDGALRGGVGGDGTDFGEGLFADELDGADAGERGDGAAGNDEEAGGEGGDGDEAEVGGAGEEGSGAGGGEGVVDVVTLGEGGGEGRVEEIPHERGGVEEVDGCDAERHVFSIGNRGEGIRDECRGRDCWRSGGFHA